MNMKAVIEGLLFVVGEDGVTIDKLKEVTYLKDDEILALLKELKKDYNSSDRGIKIAFLGNTFKLTTKKEHKEYYCRFFLDYKTDSLSNAALEVLSVIAYNPLITKFEINEIRGVDSTQVIRKLLAHDLITTSGKSNLPGKPSLYKTTNSFLDYFGMSSLSDLPILDEDGENNNTSNITDDEELFTSIYKDDLN